MKPTAVIAAVLVIAVSSQVTIGQEAAVDYPVAFVNSETITRSRVERRLAQFASRTPAEGARGATFEQALEMEIQRALILQAAQKEFDKDLKDRIRRRAGEFAAREADPKTFSRAPTEAKVQSYYDDLLLQTYVQKKITIVCAVTPAQLKQYYETNKELFSSGATVTIRELLVRQEGRSTEEAKALIDKASERLKAGESFEAVAREMTESPYASNGGLWPPQGRGSLIADVEKAAFSMKPGEVCAPFKSPLGWHIIRLEQSDPGNVRPYSEVQQQIRERLTAAQRRTAENRLINELRAKAVIRKAAS